MYYECADCGQMTTFADVERSSVVRPCPVCEERTRWTTAFEGEGVSF
ncbi:hypothetical protein [Halomarina litorea]|nr:hypothetical protein [Halomarina sp. BCD28]